MPTAEQLYTSYDMVSMQLVPNPNLKPEEVKSIDVGFRGQFDKGWFSVGGFYSDYTNFIQGRQLVPGTAATFTYRNLDKVKLWGFEAAAEWQPARNWAINTSAVYQRGKQLSAESNNAYVPFDDASPLSGILGIKYDIPKYGLSTQLMGTFSQGVKRVSDQKRFKPGGYAVYDGYLNWQIDKTFRVTASVLNIFNRRYFESTASSQDNTPSNLSVMYTNPLELYTGLGRTFAISVSANF